MYFECWGTNLCQAIENQQICALMMVYLMVLSSKSLNGVYLRYCEATESQALPIYDLGWPIRFPLQRERTHTLTKIHNIL